MSRQILVRAIPCVFDKRHPNQIPSGRAAVLLVVPCCANDVLVPATTRRRKTHDPKEASLMSHEVWSSKDLLNLLDDLSPRPLSKVTEPTLFSRRPP